MSYVNTLMSFLTGLSKSLTTFREAVTSEDSFKEYLYQFGWDATNLPSQYLAVGENIDDLIEAVGGLSENPEIADILLLLEDFSFIYSSIKNAPSPTGIIDTNLFTEQFYVDALNTLIISYLNKSFPQLYSILAFTGIISNQYIPATGNRPSYYKNSIDVDNLSMLFKDPLSLLQGILKWNDPLYTFDNIIHVLFQRLSSYKIPMRIGVVDDDLGKAYMPAYTNWDFRALEIKLLYLPNEFDFLTLKVIEYLSPTNENGIILHFELPQNLQLNIPITDNLNLEIDDNVNLGQFGFIITSSGISFKYPFLPNVLSAAGLSLQLRYTPENPTLILGRDAATRLELGDIGLIFKASLNGSDVNINAGVDLSGLTFVLNPGESDGFISKVFGDEPKVVKMPIIISWSYLTGIQFQTSGAFEIAVNPNIHLGPLTIDKLLLALKAAQDKPLTTDIAATISGVLGPVDFVVEDIGLSLKFKPEEGNAGPFDISLGFKPPNGIGLSIEASIIKGGGYVHIDTDRGLYYGAFELKIANKLGISVIAIITTKNPDGSKGFSLLVLINVTFPSVPIGFGFSLSGVGGMAGVNRDFNPEPLRLGIKTGAVEHILFPEDVVAHITAIISDLESIFPTQEKRYTFGIFFLLGWGVGVKLIDIKIGVIINVPSPVRLAIIGVISMKLPGEDSAVLKINVAFAGIIDFDQKYLSFDATIFDSKILTFSLAGDMAVRIFWGEHREILMSVGGFHPAYHPPAYLLLPPSMTRLTISIFDEDYLKLKLATYFAITSNTLQFGARIDFLFSLEEIIELVGYFGFDVLFQFNPFKFISEVYAGLSLKFKGREIFTIDLDFFLEGPGPWHAQGHATFKLLGMKKKAEFDKTWGETPDTTLPGIEVYPLLMDALNAKESWETSLPDEKQMLVHLKNIPSEDLVLPPMGVLAINQKVVPLGFRIQRYASQLPTDGGLYDISDVIFGNVSESIETVKENFAPAQFRDMNDAQKLEAASFEYMRSGVKVKSTDSLFTDGSAYMIKDVNYDITEIDVDYSSTTYSSVMDSRLVNDYIGGGVISSNPLSGRIKAMRSKPIANVAIKQEKYKLSAKDTFADAFTPQDSLAEALNLLDAQAIFADNYVLVPA